MESPHLVTAIDSNKIVTEQMQKDAAKVAGCCCLIQIKFFHVMSCAWPCIFSPNPKDREFALTRYLFLSCFCLWHSISLKYADYKLISSVLWFNYSIKSLLAGCNCCLKLTRPKSVSSSKLLLSQMHFGQKMIFYYHLLLSCLCIVAT